MANILNLIMSSSLSTRTNITSKLPLVADVNIAWHTLSTAQTLVQLETNNRTGLTDRQVIDRQREFSANELVATNRCLSSKCAESAVKPVIYSPP